MAKAQKVTQSSQSKSDEGEPSFEKALNDLEQIVEKMDSGDLSLEDLMRSFENGQKLVKICDDSLNTAELRISELEKQMDGNLSEKPSQLEN